MCFVSVYVSRSVCRPVGMYSMKVCVVYGACLLPFNEVCFWGFGRETEGVDPLFEVDVEYSRFTNSYMMNPSLDKVVAS